MNLLKRYSLLKMGIFHCYVWLPECITFFSLNHGKMLLLHTSILFKKNKHPTAAGILQFTPNNPQTLWASPTVSTIKSECKSSQRDRCPTLSAAFGSAQSTEAAALASDNAERQSWKFCFNKPSLVWLGLRSVYRLRGYDANNRGRTVGHENGRPSSTSGLPLTFVPETLILQECAAIFSSNIFESQQCLKMPPMPSLANTS